MEAAKKIMKKKLIGVERKINKRNRKKLAELTKNASKENVVSEIH